MANQAVNEMISAFSAGCMDEKNCRNLMEYIEGGGDVPGKAFGELQNVMALIAVLDMDEKPAPEVKKKVAKRLISLQNEIKEKIKTDIKTTNSFTPEKSSLGEMKDVAAVEDKKSKPLDFRKPPEKEKKADKKAEHKHEPVPNIDYNFDRKLEDRKNLIEATEEKGLSKVQWIVIFTTITFAIVVLFGLFTLYNSVTKNNEVTERKFKELEAQVEYNTQFRNNYFTLIQFFNHDDVKVVRLNKENATGESNEKIFISLKKRECILMSKDLPQLPPEKTYQVWFRTKTKDVSVGEFTPESGKQFIEFIDFAEIPADEMESVFITDEMKPSSPAPTGRVHLTGVYKKN